MIVNTFGFIDGKEGKGTRSILKTILASGMSAIAWPTHENVYERNIEFLVYNDPKHKFVHEDFITPDEIDMNDAIILSDDRPQFELINASAALIWRSSAIEVFYKDQMQRVIPIFE
jgi:hypothetical protein